MFFWIIEFEIFVGNMLMFCEVWLLSFFEGILVDVCVLCWVVEECILVVVGCCFCCFCGKERDEYLLFGEGFVVEDL